MDKGAQTDLFPWILGSLLVAVAVPAVLAFTKPAARPVPVVAAVVTPPQPRAVPAAPTPATTTTTTTAQDTHIPAPASQAQQPALPAGQVWQCVVNGQQVFSDTACGDGATIRQLSDVNGMQPTPVARAPAYSGYVPYPGYGPNPGNAPPPGYYPGPQDQDPGSPNDVYAANQVIVIDERRRHEHFAAPHPHHPMSARGHF